ncbi:hypothetical protein HHI36_018227 [Cryptolaemus montrouzieri]|uniref:Uncharacterized protein n=1 Tax=Cryptolaemus montrouzieri TaxID=559131 RepID=A0ABD2NZJ7_9CUCU
MLLCALNDIYFLVIYIFLVIMAIPRDETILRWLEEDLSQNIASESEDEDDGDLEKHHTPLSSPQEACERDDEYEEDNIPLSQLAGYQSRSGIKWSKFPPPTSRTRATTLRLDPQVPKTLP